VVLEQVLTFTQTRNTITNAAIGVTATNGAIVRKTTEMTKTVMGTESVIVDDVMTMKATTTT
jgi:hypothetical protein